MIPLLVLIISGVLITALLVVKHIESKSGEPMFAKEHRTLVDEHIVSTEQKCREFCTATNFIYIARKAYIALAHKFAKFTASIAKKVEWRARSVAHKSAKAGAEVEQVRENGYLKDVQSHKDSLDTTKVAEESKL